MLIVRVTIHDLDREADLVSSWRVPDTTAAVHAAFVRFYGQSAGAIELRCGRFYAREKWIDVESVPEFIHVNHSKVAREMNRVARRAATA